MSTMKNKGWYIYRSGPPHNKYFTVNIGSCSAESQYVCYHKDMAEAFKLAWPVIKKSRYYNAEATEVWFNRHPDKIKL